MKITKRGAKRLEKLAAFMDLFHPTERARFDMRAGYIEEIHGATASGECGFRACAGGCATLVFPELPEKGMDNSALRKFFGLDFDSGRELFNTQMSYDGAETPQAWAKQARKFLRKYAP